MFKKKKNIQSLKFSIIHPLSNCIKIKKKKNIYIYIYRERERERERERGLNLI